MGLVIASGSLKEKITGFVWQQLLLVISLFIMTFGVALCVRSSLGSSVISTIPFVLTLAGDDGLIPALTIGEWTYVMNFMLVGLQMLILRRRFEWVQLFQLVIGFLFGWLLDLNMAITEVMVPEGIAWQIMAQIVGCTVLGIGIAFEIRCGSVTMPGEGLPAAISKITRIPFAKAKIAVDITLVVIAVTLGYAYFGVWVWTVVGPGTLFAMIYVGAAVKAISPHISWFERVLCYRPGFRRYVYGLARTLRNLSASDRY
ncbi:MAG: DUF6198 family protein [Muribaculaceae bacterium]|nr:DUF6198 family protein [Muribaculaceae bacterium]